MTTFLRRSLTVLFAGLIALVPAHATQATLTADAHVDSSRPAVNLGGVSNLNVGNGYTSFVQFSLSSLPAGINASQVSKATVTFYVNRVNTAGTVSVLPVIGSWTETGITSNSQPAVGAAVGSFSASTAGQFVTVDVTSQVQSWITSPSTNLGLALNTSNADLQLDSKESGQTAHPAALDVTITSTGATGATGAQGIQGVQGVTGAQGIQGIQGVTGAQGVQGIQGVTGAQGIQGATGAQGIQGVTGATGAVGAQGVTGATGATGVTGAAGVAYRGTWNNSTVYQLNDAVSLNGSSYIAIATNLNITPGTDPTVWAVFAAMGSTGATGAAGATGPQGIQGVQGITGSQGIQGIQGVTGVTGATGATGAAGVNYRGTWSSSTIYQVNDAVTLTGSTYIAVFNNFNIQPGTDPTTWAVFAMGSTGATGATGSTGPQGIQGIQGVQGVTGAVGATGAQGVTGAVGATGAMGATGATGVTGAQGVTGATGATGAIGAAGTISYQAVWSSSTTYSKGAVVSDAGYANAWVSLVDGNVNNNPTTVGSTPNAYWARLVAQGVNGVNGVTGAQGPTGSVSSVSVSNGNATGSASVNSGTGALTINFPGSGSTSAPDPTTFSFATIPLTISRNAINAASAIYLSPIGPNSTSTDTLPAYVYVPLACHGYFAVGSAPGNYFNAKTTTTVGSNETSVGTCTASAGGSCKIDLGNLAAGSYVTVIVTSTSSSSTANTGAHLTSFACQ